MRKRLSAVISIKGNLALDSGVLVEIFADSVLGKAIYDILQDGDVTAYTSRVNLAEATYVTCRKMGHERAQLAARDLVDSGFITVREDMRIHSKASEIKCERAMSFVDCYTFAVATVTESTPVFATGEAEIVREMKKKPFDIQPVFLS